MQKRKSIAMAAAAALLSVSLLAGCSGGNNGNNGNKNEPGPSNSSQPAESPDANSPYGKTIEITIANTFDPPKDDGNYAQKYLEEKFNVKIKNIKFERATWKEQINVMLTSGEIPDILPGDAIDSDMVQWARQGIIASISEEDIRTYMPSYVADFEAVAPNAWIVGRYQGKNWGVPRVWHNGSTGFLPAYNGDWLEAIGYSEPPKNLTELEDVLTKFTFEDPDKNGKNDTYGMTGRAKDATNQMFNSVFSAFGINPYQFAVGADGNLVYSGLSEETRQGLKLLNSWYEKGIIDPEFITDDNGKIQEKFVSARTGMFDTGMWHHLYDDGYFGQISIEQGRKLVVGPPIAGPSGEGYSMSNGALQAPMLFGAQLEDDEEKRVRILQMLEYMATNEEGYLKTVYGEEGVSYTFDGDVVVWTDEYSIADKRAEMGIGGFYNALNGRVVAMEKFYMTPDKISFREKYTSGVKVITDALGPAVLESKPKYDEILRSMQDQFFVKAISGEVDTDKGFDEFVSQWLKSGGQEVLDEVNKVYKERNV